MANQIDYSHNWQTNIHLTHKLPCFLIFPSQKFESDSEEDDTAAVASPVVNIKEESSANDSVTPNEIEMISSEDVGNNVTICHDADIKDRIDGRSDETQPDFANNPI